MYIATATRPRARNMGSYLLNSYLSGPRRRGMRGLRLGQDSPFDDGTLPLAPPSSAGPSIVTYPGESYPGQSDNSINVGTLPLAPPASVGPQVTNYSPAAVVPNPLNYANAATAIAAGIPASVANAAFAAQPASGIFGSISGNTLLLFGAGIAAFALIAGAGGGRRR